MKLRRYWTLGRRHFFLLCRAFCIVAYFRITLCFVKYKRLSKSISVTAVETVPQTPTPGAIAWAIKNTARIVPFASCLTQALALQHMLGKRGEKAVIRVGVRTTDAGRIMAHAWVIFQGVILIGGPQSNIDRYVVMTDLKPG
ncbi:MAG: lasso peptide biosynthesis B2 protein [Pseudomonadota bacterium]